MIELSDDPWSQIHRVAVQAIRSYAQGLLTVEVLGEQLLQEWRQHRMGDEEPSQGVLIRLAQRICSRTLCEAWRSPQPDIRNCAFDNLRHYLARLLSSTSYAKTLEQYEHAKEDVLHQTLEELYLVLSRNPPGPNEPAAFLKWTQTILMRQARLYVQTSRRHDYASLEAQQETLAEQFADEHNPDPEEHILSQELQQAVKDVILSLRNRRYQQVLFYIYLVGMTESELALLLDVDVQEIYMWKHRALKALRNNPELIQRLRSLRE